MKYIFSQMIFFLTTKSNQRNMKFMLRFIVLVLALIILYSVLFHILMDYENRAEEHSAITGLYWTLTVMSTLGFGDITFHSDPGRLFSILVMLSGILLFMLVLPFTFIRFVYSPWLEAQTRAIVPARLPEDTKNHVIVAGLDSVAQSVVDRLRDYAIPYAHLIPDHTRALEQYDKRYNVMTGDLDSPQTYSLARVEQAALVAALCDDLKNTNIAATVREISPTVRIAGSVDNADSTDILQLAGCNYTYHFLQMLGESLARRVFRPGTRSNIIATLGDLCVMEVPSLHTEYVGIRLKDTDLRGKHGLTAVGVWCGKKYEAAMPDTVIREGATLLLAGTAEQARLFEAQLTRNRPVTEEAPALILGGGRVGLAVARTLEKRGAPFRLVEKKAALIPAHDERYVSGSAADIEILRKAGIDATHTAIVTTHNDDLNIYLTIYCRKLRPDIQIFSRATLDRNIESLYGAGANLVMSHATMAANAITNLLRPGRVTMLTEGLNLFRVPLPKSLAGKSLMESAIRQETQCNVVAITSADGMRISPDPRVPLHVNDELVLIGTVTAERSFMEKFMA